MAKFLKIEKKDALNTGREKLNNAIDGSEDSLKKSKQAINVSNNAIDIARQSDDKSDATQQQLDNIIIESGTSDAETIQARGEYPLLNDRLNSTDQQRINVDDKAFYNGLMFNRQQKPLLVFVDDDGHPLFYDLIKPVIESEEVSVATAIITGRVDNSSSSMTLRQVKECQRAGAEVVGHTHNHVDLSSLPPEEQEIEIRTSKEYLQKHGFNHDVLVYPFGGADSITQEITARYHSLGVYIDYGQHRLNHPPILQYRLERVYLNQVGEMFVQRCKDKIDEAIATNGLLVIGMHCHYAGFEPTGLVEVIQYAKQQGIEIASFKRALEVYGNIIDLPGFRIGADGNPTGNRIGVYQNLDFIPTNNTPITDFPENKVTKVAINTADVVGFPIRDSCSLFTYRFGTTHSFQEIHSSLRNESFRRRWVGGTSGSWGEWYMLQNTIFDSRVRGTTLIEYFKVNSVTKTYLSSSNSEGLPRATSGVLDTHRFDSDFYSYQVFRESNAGRIYHRSWNTESGDWSDWLIVSPQSFSFTHTFDFGSIAAKTTKQFDAVNSAKYIDTSNFTATVVRGSGNPLPAGVISDYHIAGGRAYFRLANITDSSVSVGEVVFKETETKF